MSRQYILYKPPDYSPETSASESDSTVCSTNGDTNNNDIDLLHFNLFTAAAAILLSSTLMQPLGSILPQDDQESDGSGSYIPDYHLFDDNTAFFGQISVLLFITTLSDLNPNTPPMEAPNSTSNTPVPFLEFTFPSSARVPGQSISGPGKRGLPAFVSYASSSRRLSIPRDTTISLSATLARYGFEIVDEEVGYSETLKDYMYAGIHQSFSAAYSAYKKAVFGRRVAIRRKTRLRVELAEQTRSYHLSSCERAVMILDQFHIVAGCLMSVLEFIRTDTMDSSLKEGLREYGSIFKLPCTISESDRVFQWTLRRVLGLWGEGLRRSVSTITRKKSSTKVDKPSGSERDYRDTEENLALETYNMGALRALVYYLRAEIFFYAEALTTLLLREDLHARSDKGLLRETQLDLIYAAVDRFVWFVRERLIGNIGNIRCRDGEQSGESCHKEKTWQGRAELLEETKSFLRANLRLVEFLVELRAPSVEVRIWRYLHDVEVPE